METHRSGRVVVGIDDTLSGLHALRRAVTEARRRAMPLRAVRAWSPRPSSGYPMLPDQREEEAAAASEFVAGAFTTTMGGLPPDVTVEVVLVADSAGAVLVRLADHDEDLLVIGAGRRRPWRRLSRTTRYCLARAVCPVLVVPPPPLARAGSQRALMRQLRREIEHLAGGG